MVAINTIKMSEDDPEDARRRAILRQQAYADLLAQNVQRAGGDKVYGHGLGLAKVGGAALAGLWGRQADEQERSEEAMANELIAGKVGKAFGGGSDAVSPSDTGEASLPPGPAAPSMAGGGARRTMDAGRVQQAGEIYQGLIKRGVPSMVAAGLVGQTGSESSVNPGAVGDGGTSVGLWQHHADRAQALRQRAQQAGKPWQDREVQMDHVVAELNGPERAAYDAARAARTPEESASILASKFERPQAEALARTLGARQSLARQVYGGAPVSGGGGTPAMAGGSGAGSGISAQDVQELVRNPRTRSYGLALYNAHVQDIATRQAQAAEIAKEQRTQAFEREKIGLTKEPKLTTLKAGETAIDSSGKVVAEGNGGQGGDPKELAEVRKEILSLPSYKTYAESLPAFRSMTDAAKRDSKSSDLNLVYGVGKVFDPKSVVREGEIVMAQDTGGVAERLNGMIRSLQGGARLSPEQRAGLLQEAQSRVIEHKNAWETDAQFYSGIAERRKYNRADVIPNFPDMPGFDPTTISTVPRGPAGPAAAPAAGPANVPPGMPAPGGQPPMKTWAHKARRPDGTVAVSDDGERWFDPKTGQPFDNPPVAQPPPGPPPDPLRYQLRGQPSPARSSLPYSSYPVSGVRG